MPKNSGLKLFTKTWPRKCNSVNNAKFSNENKEEEENARPLTATLEKPTVLDIRFIGIVDMSTIRKEFLNISNLCRFPLSITVKRKKQANTTSTASVLKHRPLSLPSPEKSKKKRVNTSKRSEDSWDEEESSSVQSAKTMILSHNASRNNVRNPSTTSHKIDCLNKKSPISDANNNNKTFKIPRKRVSQIAKLLDVNNKSCDLSGGSSSNNNNNSYKSTKLPEPCKTCGRPDQPERFHSHPVTPLKVAKKIEEPPPKMKSTVQKPIAIKYKSKQNENKKVLPPPTRKSSLPAQKLVHTPPNISGQAANTNNSVKTPPARQGSAKRLLTCYICGREFGTASLPLHEPKCLQKWERENATLPSHLQRKPPIKPDHALSQEEWNQFAWESSQSTLAPCANCGRTFYPDRLVVHQRSCKIARDNSKLQVEKLPLPPAPAAKPTSPPMPPPKHECYICRKMFGAHSLKIHEKQCLKKWHAENDSLPADMRAPEPVRREVQCEANAQNGICSKKIKDEEGGLVAAMMDSGSTRTSPMFPCYLCGRLFTVNSIYIHEPQCLKSWKNENDKLPPNKRRAQPLKPDIKFTPDGKIDYGATNEAKWQCHLSQLIPCQYCARTFNPDRVEVHEKSCKGPI